MNTKELAQQYFNTWTKSCDAARALMADDMTFEGSMNTYRGADSVLVPLRKFTSMMKSARLLKVITEGDDAALLYDCEMPFGTLRTAEHIHFENGKVKSTYLAYDTSELRKLMAQKG
jgi:hypothetical protein